MFLRTRSEAVSGSGAVVGQASGHSVDTYTSATYSQDMFIFVETRLFTRLVGEYLDDDEYLALQNALTANPEAGTVIPGSGGVRKLRWATTGRGKRGGVRIIYFLKVQAAVIWMLTMYAKNETDSIPATMLRRIRQEIDNG
jgi:hypothetical protein